MRLTLRTLLAYLDDTLDPAQAKLIGQKVAESPAAQELIARIKDVVRRRRLTTPPPGGISDPNTIAEYIDSELPAERLAEVEEACLSSDVHLAEIAACHQILTVILSEPILVPPTAKARMYGLRRGREASHRRPAIAAPAPAEHNGPVETTDATDERLLLGLPLYQRHGPLLARLAPILGVLLLAGALVAFIIVSLHSLLPSPASAPKNDGTGDRVVGVPNNAGGNENRATTEDVKVLEKRKHQAAQKQVASIALASQMYAVNHDGHLPKTLNALTVHDEAGGPYLPAEAILDPWQKPYHYDADGKHNKGAKPDVWTVSPDGDVISNWTANGGTTPEVASKPPQPGNVTDPAPPNNEKPVDSNPAQVEHHRVGMYVSQEKPHTVLFQRLTDKDRWQRVHGPRSVIQSGYALLSLPGYRSEVDLNKGVRLTLWGDLPDPNRLVAVAESMATLHDSPSADLDVTLQRGRIAITNNKKTAAQVRLRFEQEVWEITLDDPAAEVIVERWGSFSPGVGYTKEALADGPEVGVALVSSHGTCHLKIGSFTQLMHEPEGPALFLWDNTQAPERTPRTLKKLQRWLTQANYTPTEARDLESLSTRLEKEEPDIVLPQAVKDDQQFERRIAVHSLAAMDDLGDLIDALGDENHRDVRLEAINALRRWMATDKGYAQKVHDALLRKFNSTGEIANALLYTFSVEQLSDPNTWEMLIARLDHPNLAVRELADAQLALLLPEWHRSIPYDPAGETDQREVAVAMWKRIIPSGQLPPRPGQPPPPLDKPSKTRPPRRPPRP